MLVKFGNNWIQKIPRTAKLDEAVLAVLGIFLIQLFPNWTACSPITYTNYSKKKDQRPEQIKFTIIRSEHDRNNKLILMLAWYYNCVQMINVRRSGFKDFKDCRASPFSSHLIFCSAKISLKTALYLPTPQKVKTEKFSGCRFVSNYTIVMHFLNGLDGPCAYIHLFYTLYEKTDL